MSNGFSSDCAQPLGHAHRVAGIGDVVEQHVNSSPPGAPACTPGSSRVDDVGGAQARLQPPRHRDQQAVGRERAEAVVHDP